MADADLQIKASLDVSDAQRKFKQLGDTSSSVARDIQQEMTQALERSTEETKKLAGAMEKTGEHARMSAEQIGGLAIAMGGLALNLAGEVARHQGHDDTADYLHGVGGGVMAGATAGMAAGPIGAVIGGFAGGIMGGAGTWLQHDRRDREAAEAEAEAKRKAAEATERMIAANIALVEKFDRLQAASKESEAFFERLGDTTRSVGERQQELTDRMARFRAEEAKLRDALADEANLSNPAKMRELFGEFTRNQQEIRKMERADIKDGEKKPTAAAAAAETAGERRAEIDTDSLQRLGISLGGASQDYSRQTLKVAEEQLVELRRLNERPIDEGGALWQ